MRSLGICTVFLALYCSAGLSQPITSAPQYLELDVASTDRDLVESIEREGLLDDAWRWELISYIEYPDRKSAEAACSWVARQSYPAFPIWKTGKISRTVQFIFVYTAN